MRIEEGDAADDDEAEPKPSDDAEAREKVIVRSNGVVTYVGKDIANQFWKFGLLGKDFRYRLFAHAGRRPSAVGHDVGRHRSGGAAVRPGDAHLQRHRLAPDVPAGAAQPGAANAGASRRSRALGSLLLRDGGAVARHGAGTGLRDAGRRRRGARKPFVEVSGRKGLGVKIDDLLDLLIEKAASRGRQAEPGALARRTSRARRRRLPSAAIRYFMLKFSRGKLIVFDIEEALSFEGETGPYLQYAVVRANNIFNKLQEREGLRRLPASLAPASTTTPGRRARIASTAGRWCFEAVPARRRRRSGGAVARVLGPGQVRVRPRADVQRLLPPLPDSRRGARRTLKRWRAAGGRLRPGRADARARPDGHRRAGPDVTQPNTMALIGVTNCRKLEDYRQAVLHVGGEVRVLDPSTDVAGGARRPRRPDAHRRRRRRAGEIRRGAASDVEDGRAGPRRLRAGARRAGAGRAAADPRHLPRRAGAERRVRRHARAGHPVAGARRARAQARGPAASGVRARARNLDRQGHRCSRG